MQPKPTLFISPKAALLDWPTPPRSVEPLGLLHVAAAFRAQGVPVTILDLESNSDPDALIRTLQQERYGLIAIALTGQLHVWSAFAAARDARCLCPDAHIVVGGVFATLNADWVLETCPEIDGVCRGEGEGLAETYIDDPFGLLQVPIVANRTPITEPRTKPHMIAPYRATLDEYPLAARDLLPATLAGGELPSIVAARGCGAACTFCAVPIFSGKRWRMRSPSSVVTEIRDLSAQYGANRFHLIDDNIFGHTPDARASGLALLDALADVAPDITFRAACRFDDLDDDVIAKLSAAGVTLLKLGVETLGEATQKQYGKLLPAGDVERSLNRVLAAGIDVSLGFIMFDPFCSMADIRRNFDFLQAYRQCWGRHLLRSRLTAYRRTAVEKRVRRAGLDLHASAFGTEWRFADEDVAQFHADWERAAHELLLPVEWAVWRHWRAGLHGRVELSHTALRDIDGEIRDLYMMLFAQVLADPRNLAGAEGRARTVAAAVQNLTDGAAA